MGSVCSKKSGNPTPKQARDRLTRANASGSLAMPGETIHEWNASELTTIAQLKHLDLANCTLSATAQSQLADALANATGMRKLNLSGCGESAVPDVLPPKLKSLTLKHCQLRSLPALPASLKLLAIDCNPDLTASTIAAAVANCPVLETLSASACDLNYIPPFEAQPLGTLETLVISGNPGICSLALHAPHDWSRAVQLRTLDASRCTIPATTEALPAVLLALPKLQAVKLQGNGPEMTQQRLHRLPGMAEYEAKHKARLDKLAAAGMPRVEALCEVEDGEG